MDDMHGERGIPLEAPVLVRAFGKALAGLGSLVAGLAVTWRNFLLPHVTVHYPRQVISFDRLESFRGHIELGPDPESPGQPLCVACGLCAKVCPSNCITIQTGKAPALPGGKEKKIPVVFTVDFTRCSLCGLCVQGCPAGGLRFSHDLYSVGFSREEFHYDLLARLQGAAPPKETPETTPGSGEA